MTLIYKYDNKIHFNIPLCISYQTGDTKEIIESKIINQSSLLIEQAVEMEEIVEAQPKEYYYETTLAAHFVALDTLAPKKGVKWVISKEIYKYYTYMCTPIHYKKGYLYEDGQTGGYRSYHYKKRGTYWHEYIKYDETQNPSSN